MRVRYEMSIVLLLTCSCKAFPGFENSWRLTFDFRCFSLQDHPMWTTRFSQWVLVDVLKFQLQPVKVNLKQDYYLFVKIFTKNVQLSCTEDIVHHWKLTLHIYNFAGFEFYCLGSWTDEDGNVWMGVRDRGEDVHRYKYRCLVSINWKKKQYKKAFQLKANYPLITGYHMSAPSHLPHGPIQTCLLGTLPLNRHTDWQTDMIDTIAFSQTTCAGGTNFQGQWDMHVQMFMQHY